MHEKFKFKRKLKKSTSRALVEMRHRDELEKKFHRELIDHECKNLYTLLPLIQCMPRFAMREIESESWRSSFICCRHLHRRVFESLTKGGKSDGTQLFQT